MGWEHLHKNNEIKKQKAEQLKNEFLNKPLNEIFEYKNGEIYWKIVHPMCNNKKVGDLAGNKSSKVYFEVTIAGSPFRVHRIIWQMFNGPIPEGYYIDHIDGNPSNNKLENLRLANQKENSRNSKKPKNNTSGYKGVHWNKEKEKWQARVMINTITKHIGYFEDLIEAAKAYNEAALKYHGEFAKLNEI
jgi:hypothetical protein